MYAYGQGSVRSPDLRQVISWGITPTPISFMSYRKRYRRIATCIVFDRMITEQTEMLDDSK